jgi:Predicted Na+-dependent transporter
MKTIISIRNFIQKTFPIIVIIVCAIAFFVPSAFSWGAPINSYLMSFIMFGMALTMELSDFKILFKKPKITILGILFSYTLSAGMAFIAYKLFGIPAALGVGLVLCGACPGGNITDVMTFIANGDVPLSVGISSIATMLSPIVTPAIVFLLFNTIVEVNLGELVIGLLRAVIIPIIIGLVVKNLFRDKMKRVEEVSPLLSFLCLILMTGIIVSLNGSKLLEMNLMIFVASSLYIILPLFAGYFLCRAFKLTIWESRTVAFECGLKNTILASMLATVAFPDLVPDGVGLPGIITSLLAIVIAPIIAKGWASYDRKHNIAPVKEEQQARA